MGSPLDEPKADVLKNHFDYEYEVYDKDGTPIKRTVTFKKWSLLQAPKQVARIGKILYQIKKERTDFSFNNFTQHVDVLFMTAPETCLDIIRDSFPFRTAEQDKSDCLNAMDLADGMLVLFEVLALNFLDGKILENFRIISERMQTAFQAPTKETNDGTKS